MHHFQQKPTATYAIEKINQLIKCTKLLTHITRSSANIILTSHHHTFTSEKPNMSTSSSTASTRVRSHSYKVYILQCIIFLFKLLTLANLLFMQIRYPIVRPPAIIQFRAAFHNDQVIVQNAKSFFSFPCICWLLLTFHLHDFLLIMSFLFVLFFPCFLPCVFCFCLFLLTSMLPLHLHAFQFTTLLL